MSPAFAASAAVAARAFGPSSATSVGQRLRPARVADHDVVAVRDRQSRDLAADVSGADESDGLHDGEYSLNELANHRDNGERKW